jgi:hypothetical protein
MEEQFIRAHERLINEYLKGHPGATWEAAYEITADDACEYCIAEVVELADAARRRVHGFRREAC